MIQLVGFAPDQDPTTPGVVVACQNVIPSPRGLQGAPSPIDAVPGLAALASDCRGSAVLRNTTGTRRHFAGTQTAIYEQSGTAWVDVSKGSAYVGAAESRWVFEQFGNISLATNDVEKIQWADTTAFADIAAAPIAKVVFATDNFVFALDCDHTATGNNPDGWMCSAYQDYSSWTASVTTQATSGRLIGDGGALTAGAALGPYAVAYKERNIFLGSYVGSPVVWQWERIPGEIGCVGPDALADIGGAHVFVGRDNVWLFNGTNPVSIADNVIRDWLFANMNPAKRELTTVRYDPRTGNVWIWYASGVSTAMDACVVYNRRNSKWGVVDMSIEAAVYMSTPGVTWETIETVAATWDDFPSISWDSPFWAIGTESMGIFNTSHELKTLSGSSTGGQFTTGDFGDDSLLSMIRASRIRFTQAPTSATAQALSKMESGTSGMPGTIATYSGGKFDHRQSGRFHRISYTMVGPFEATGIQPELIRQGQR